MSVLHLLLWFALAWVVVVTGVWLLVVPWLRRGPRGTALFGFIWFWVRLYARWWHRVSFEGTEHLPTGDDDHDGLILVSNHTGSVDPLLIQAGCRFWIRWMMGADMISPGVQWATDLQEVIPVDRTGGDSRALREAIRHVKEGGCVGVFPEARIVNPPGQVRPFQPGVGAIVRATRAPVLLVWVSGTPPTNDLRLSLRLRSRARVVVLGRLDFAGERDPRVITETLRERLAEASGWPINDEPQPLTQPPPAAARGGAASGTMPA